MTTSIKAKCSCGSNVNVILVDHIKTSVKPTDLQISSALLGQEKCPKCGKEIWVRGYIEMH